jgi:hypothetical protein
VKRSTILNIITKITKNRTLLSALLVASCVVVSTAAAASLTASTSLTIVHVTDYQSAGSSAVPGYTNDWPTSPDHTTPVPSGREMSLRNVYFTSHSMDWTTIPSTFPYGTFGNGLNAMVAAVWSKDGGKTFKMLSWDYLRPTTKGKGTEKGMPDCWMGTMIHTICDRKAGECNGRYRSNLFFTEWPSGAAGCWGTLE